jgi:metacaspase-1
MTRGVSLNIGLNRVDPACYGGWDGALSGCLNDAASMQGIADSMGFASTRLSDAEATADAVIEHIGRVATQLESGDTFLVTYSGHGGQVPDDNGDENDGQDETWVLYDRMLLDDELAALWSQFASGVRIFVLSDSCHSGTVARVLITRQGGAGIQPGLRAGPRYRLAPAAATRASFQLQRRLYRSLQWISGSRTRSVKDASASILLISGCQDNQLSQDGDVNGLFTEKLLRAWNGGRFQGTYRQFWQAICTQMPPEQSPNYFLTGQSDPDFEAERPFTIGASGGTQPGASDGGAPSVTGPVCCRRGDAPPMFTITRPAGTYYVFEICTRAELLDISNHGAERSTSNFYGSWADSGVPARLSSDQFQLPQSAWTALRQSDQLYYRIITTTSPSGWDGAVWSTPDHQCLSAPSVQVLAAGSAPGSQPGAQPPSGQPAPQPGGGTDPVLRLGSRGEDVRRLQAALVQHGYTLVVDGDFGAKTVGAVRDFQRNHGLTADGVVGQQTWAALYRSVPNNLIGPDPSYPGHD